MAVKQDDDSETAMWREMKDRSKEKRAANREQSPKILEEHGISFSSHNLGAHLIVIGKHESIDFWPGTGRWMVRAPGKGKGFGVFNMIKRLKGE